MAKSNNQKGKVLYLEHLLCDTGEDRIISMQEILTYLQDRGISAERKSIYDDLDVLRSFGMNIQYRRGKPGGYFLAGAYKDASVIDTFKNAGEMTTSSEEETDKDNAPGIDTVETVLDTSNPSEEDTPPACAGTWSDLWTGGDGQASGQLRQIRLSCTEEALPLVRQYFGESAEYKDKTDGTFLVTGEVAETSFFYGWLTAMGKAVRLLKPKKVAQAYREYLKEIARDYKV
ncbi:MAG: WYL domain-containing protein [Blautia sp.]|nr:WYL domain-containing protein [Blautia sp.]